jgi:hypothetical protein
MKTFKALVVDRKHISATYNSKGEIQARWLEIKGRHRNNVYSKIQRLSYIIVCMFEVGSEKEQKLRTEGLFKNYKTNHQKYLLQNQKQK